MCYAYECVMGGCLAADMAAVSGVVYDSTREATESYAPDHNERVHLWLVIHIRCRTYPAARYVRRNIFTSLPECNYIAGLRCRLLSILDKINAFCYLLHSGWVCRLRDTGGDLPTNGELRKTRLRVDCCAYIVLMS